MQKVRLAIVDDHQLFRDGIAELIEGFGAYELLIQADNGKDFIRQLGEGGRIPEVVLLDINMKEMDGFETATWLKENYPDIKILALSMYENETAIIRMLRLGSRGYILKNIRKQELEQALSSVVTKGYYYTDMITGKLLHAINNIDQPRSATMEIASLNEREIEFLKFACTELTYKEISEKMNFSIHTIDGYRNALFEKLNIKNRVGLVLYAIKNKIFLVE